MKKWMLGMLATLFVGLFCIPMTVLAAPTKTVKIGTTELNEATPYYHNGADGAQGTVDNNPTDANAAFDASTGTLTLNGLHIETNEKAIYWTWQSNGNHDLNIVLADNSINTLICTASWDGIAINGAVGASGGPSLTIQGSGTLNATGNNHGIWVWQNVVIEGDAVVNASCVAGEAICNNSYNGTVTIKDNAVVTATGDTYGIGYSNGRTNTPVIQGGTLTIKGGTAAFQSAPDLEKYYYQAWVGNDEGDAATWDDVTALGSYQYVKLTVSGMKHIHSWATEWSSDADYHWHNCQGEGDCNIADVSQKDGYGTHGYDNDEDASCDTCGYTRTININPDIDDKVESGTVENTTDKITNECNAMLDVSGSDLMGKVLSTEEQQKVADGKNAKIWLEVKAGESMATEEDKTLTQAKLGDYSLGMYLDLTLWKQFDGESAATVSATNGAVSVKFAIPQNLINTDTSKTRAYEIIRIHNDGTGAKADILPCSFDAATKEITFETDRFSIYALAYKDTVNTPAGGGSENNGGENGGGNDSNDGATIGGENTSAEDKDVDDTEEDNEDDTPAATETKQKDNVPKTGDNNCVSAWFLIALVSGIAVLFFGKRCLVVKK